MRKKKQPSDSEAKVLGVLLKSQDKMTVKQICAELNSDGIPWLLRTVSTFLERLEEKGLVGHEKINITNHYFANIDKKEYQISVAKNFLGTYFDGSLASMLTAFSEKGELSKDDIKNIELWIRENKK